MTTECDYVKQCHINSHINSKIKLKEKETKTNITKSVRNELFTGFSSSVNTEKRIYGG